MSTPPFPATATSTASFNLCLRFTGNFDAADDAAQESFIAALHAIPRLQGGNFRS
ncbi:MAG TPA: sigma factor [Chloroflexota bacterium]|nr:sigma factor [Chloroflexota bacterium]